MKRSEINAELKWAVELCKKYNITLPRYAYWTMDEWKENIDKIDGITDVMCGWDITDYGTGKYDEIGCVLFTLRNGKKDGSTVPYCEKYLMFHDGQRLPIHYHVLKTEDIITRAGGDMWIKLYGKNEDGSVNMDCTLEYESDGLMGSAKAGEPIVVTPGNSIRLVPLTNHTFGSVAGTGDCVCGEVSKVNDDLTDNYFAEPIARFADIEEDEPILYPLCNEYGKLFGK